MLKKESSIMIEMNREMNDELYSTLVSCYLPLMGENAYIFYMSLLSMKKQNFILTNHLLLQRITNLSYEAMEKARIRCEEFLLLRTYYKKDEDQYLYVLEKPLKATRFLSHEVFGRMFINKMGQDAYTFYKQQLNKKRLNKNGFEEISSTLKDTLRNNWDHEREMQFQEVKETAEQIRYESMNIIFDEKVFLNGLSEMIFPKKERTTQNLRMIAETATIYGINEKMMKRLIARGIDVASQKFDVQRLRTACMNSKAKYVSDNKDPYKLPPRRFLEYKQSGAPLTQADVRLIEKLLCDYKLQPEVVNILLETCINKDKNKAIVETRVLRMASGWQRLKIDTLEKAKTQQKLEMETKPVSNVKTGIVQEWKKEEDNMSEEERNALMEEMAKWGEE